MMKTNFELVFILFAPVAVRWSGGGNGSGSLARPCEQDDVMSIERQSVEKVITENKTG